MRASILGTQHSNSDTLNYYSDIPYALIFEAGTTEDVLGMIYLKKLLIHRFLKFYSF